MLVKHRKPAPPLQDLLDYWATSIKPKGYEAFAYEEGKVITLASLDFPDDILPIEQAKLAQQAFGEIKGQKTILASKYLAVLNKLTKALQKEPARPYIWVAKLSARIWTTEERTSIGGVTVRLRRRLPGRFKKARDALLEEFHVTQQEPHKYCWVTVSVKARTPEAACDLAADTFDQLRGMWNLAINRRTVQVIMSSGLKPINKLVLSPVRSIHSPTGKSAMQGLMLDDNAKLVTNLLDWPKEGHKVRTFEKQLRGYLRRIPFAAEMLTAFERYTRALDGTDFQAAYLKLWALLEMLTAIDPGSYDQLVRRTAFVWKDVGHARLFLQSLRSQRNIAVHRDHVTRDIESVVYMLKRHVEAVFLVALVHGPHFQNLREFGRFLDLPSSAADLRAGIAVRKRALKFL